MYKSRMEILTKVRVTIHIAERATWHYDRSARAEDLVSDSETCLHKADNLLGSEFSKMTTHTGLYSWEAIRTVG